MTPNVSLILCFSFFRVNRIDCRQIVASYISKAHSKGKNPLLGSIQPTTRSFSVEFNSDKFANLLDLLPGQKRPHRQHFYAPLSDDTPNAVEVKETDKR